MADIYEARDCFVKSVHSIVLADVYIYYICDPWHIPWAVNQSKTQALQYTMKSF